MPHALHIDDHLTIDKFVPANPRSPVTVYYPLNSYNPYERLGKHMRDAIYQRCNYHINYDKVREYDAVVVRHYL